VAVVAARGEGGKSAGELCSLGNRRGRNEMPFDSKVSFLPFFFFFFFFFFFLFLFFLDRRDLLPKEIDASALLIFPAYV
jgi:hypothetical protein